MDTPDIAPLAGLRGLEHVGLTVPDMAQALEFFSTVLGAETLYEVGPVRADDNWMAVNLGVETDAVIPRIVMIRVGVHGPAIELFEYAHAGTGADTDAGAGAAAERHPPPQSAVGGQHLAFYIEDIDAGVESLRAHGVIALGEPKRIVEGPSKGLAWVHFLAPWGQQLELASYPSGIAAYADRTPSVWTPGGGIDPPSGDEPADADGVERLRDPDGELDADPA